MHEIIIVFMAVTILWIVAKIAYDKGVDYGYILGLEEEPTALNKSSHLLNDMICPLEHRKLLEDWCKQYYDDTPSSYFEKQNKTYLISLWYTRPPQDDLPRKIYKKGG